MDIATNFWIEQAWTPSSLEQAYKSIILDTSNMDDKFTGTSIQAHNSGHNKH
jgi:hypothetical protein